MKRSVMFGVMAVLIFCCVVVVLAWAFELVYKTGYECFDAEGKERWHATSTVVMSGAKDRPIHLLTEKGEGRKNGYNGKVSWTTTLEYEITDDTLRPIEMKTIVFDEDGYLLEVELQKFDHMNNTVLFESKNIPAKKTIRKKMEFKGDIVNRLTLVVYTRHFLKKGKREVTVTMLTNDPKLFKIRIKVIGTEELKVNGYKQNAFKIILDPQLGLMNVAKAFLPKMYIWNDTGPYFDWLKYEGPESSTESSVVVIKWTPKYSGNPLVNRILEDLSGLMQFVAKPNSQVPVIEPIIRMPVTN